MAGCGKSSLLQFASTLILSQCFGLVFFFNTPFLQIFIVLIAYLYGRCFQAFFFTCRVTSTTLKFSILHSTNYWDLSAPLLPPSLPLSQSSGLCLFSSLLPFTLSSDWRKKKQTTQQSNQTTQNPNKTKKPNKTTKGENLNVVSYFRFR